MHQELPNIYLVNSRNYLYNYVFYTISSKNTLTNDK